MALVLGNNANKNYISHGDIAAIDGASVLTIAWWLNVGPAVSGGPITKGTLTFFQMGGSQEFWVRDSSAGWDLLTATGTVSQDITIYDHYAMVYDGTQPATSRITVYKNAISLALTGLNINSPQGSDALTTAPTSLPSSANALEIGNANTNFDIGHVRIWAAALSQAEVAQEQHRYWASRQAGWLLDAPYDDALWARDYSGNGNHGTWDLVNGTPAQRQGPPVAYGGKVLVTG